MQIHKPVHKRLYPIHLTESLLQGKNNSFNIEIYPGCKKPKPQKSSKLKSMMDAYRNKDVQIIFNDRDLNIKDPIFLGASSGELCDLDVIKIAKS